MSPKKNEKKKNGNLSVARITEKKTDEKLNRFTEPERAHKAP